jgi:hypothetical protein
LDAQDLRKGDGGGGVLWERGRSLLCQAFKGTVRARFPKRRPRRDGLKNARYPTHYARSPCRFASPTARAPRGHDLRFFTWSSDRAVDACHWRAQQLLGPPALRSLKRACSRAGLPGATVGVLDTGVSRSTCSWAPSSAHLQPRGESRTQATENTLTRRRLVRRTTVENAKDQKTSS